MKEIKTEWISIKYATGEDRGYPDEEDMVIIDTKKDHITIFPDGDISIEKKEVVE